MQAYWEGLLGDIYPVWYAERYKWNRYATLLKEKVNIRAGSVPDVLDCACGGCGQPAIALASLGWKITASDGSIKMLEKAKEQFRRHPSIVVTDKATSWTELTARFGNNRFDGIVCAANSISHLSPAELNRNIRQMIEVVRPGGFIVIDIKQYIGGKEMAGEYSIRQIRDDGYLDLPSKGRVRILTENIYPDQRKDEVFIKVTLVAEDGICEEHIFNFWAIDEQLVRNTLEGEQIDNIETIKSEDWKYTVVICFKKK